MKVCIKCGALLNEGAKFCGNCGWKGGGLMAKLPFRKLAEKIPASVRTKVPLLDKAIPYANQIVCGLAAWVVVVSIANSGGSAGGGASGYVPPAQSGGASAQVQEPAAQAQTAQTQAASGGEEVIAEKLSIDQLMQDYEKNKIQADSRWKGKTLTLTGEFYDIREAL
jgi:hypothetical protein